jgi:hypothetical protein
MIKLLLALALVFALAVCWDIAGNFAGVNGVGGNNVLCWDKNNKVYS